MYYTIYKVTNLVNDRYYIGKHKTQNLNDGYMGSGKLLKQAIKKYGIKNFSKEILHVYDNEEDMNHREKELVDLSETSYNLCPGGHGGFGYINNNGIKKFHGKTHTKETIKKILESRKNYKHSDETKRKISENNKRTNESRGKKTSKALTGRKKSEEHKRKIAESIRKKYEEKRLSYKG